MQLKYMGSKLWQSRHASGRTCAGRPAADSAGPATAARPGRTAGTHAPHKGVPGRSASATRTFAGSPVSCCTAFQRRSVTRLRRRQGQARLKNRKEGPARRSPSTESTRKTACQGWKHLDFYIKNPRRPRGVQPPEMEAFRFLYKKSRAVQPAAQKARGRLLARDGSSLCTRVAYSNNIAVTDPAKLAQEFTQPHFYTACKKKARRAEVRLQGELQANRGCVTLQRRGCRSNSGLEILRRTRSFPERTSSARSVAAILWELTTLVYRERPNITPVRVRFCSFTVLRAWYM